MKFRSRHVWLCSAALVLWLVSPIAATVMIPTDLPDVTASATLIVRGRVIDTRAFTDVANGPVMTAVTIAVSESLKGTAERTVTFRAHGGELGRYRQVLVGAPTFAVGDEAYFFLKRAAAGDLWTVGLGAGVYKISLAAGVPVVNPPMVAGLTATVGEPVVRGDSRRKPMAVSDFTGVVRLLMAARAGGAR